MALAQAQPSASLPVSLRGNPLFSSLNPLFHFYCSTQFNYITCVADARVFTARNNPATSAQFPKPTLVPARASFATGSPLSNISNSCHLLLLLIFLKGVTY